MSDAKTEYQKMKGCKRGWIFCFLWLPYVISVFLTNHPRKHLDQDTEAICLIKLLCQRTFSCHETCKTLYVISMQGKVTLACL